MSNFDLEIRHFLLAAKVCLGDLKILKATKQERDVGWAAETNYAGNLASKVNGTSEYLE